MKIFPQKIVNSSGLVVLLTGLSGAGKSTLATGLKQLLQEQHIKVCLLDGDQLRRGLCADLGFSKKDRSENMRRSGEVAKLFAKEGFVTLIALIAPFQADRKRLRTSCIESTIPFAEVFVDASLTTCEARDPRGLYAKARCNAIAEFTGISSPYEPPDAPDLHLSSEQRSYEETLEELGAFVLEKLFSQT